MIECYLGLSSMEVKNTQISFICEPGYRLTLNLQSKDDIDFIILNLLSSTYGIEEKDIYSFIESKKVGV